MNDLAQQISETLAGNHLLVDVVLRRWTGKRTDREASDELTISKHATSNSAKVVKDLMANARGELKAVAAAQDNLRGYVYNHTIPWSATPHGRMVGSRLLSAAKSLEFLAEFKKYYAIYESALNDFLEVYDVRREQALNNLGGLGKEEDYPTVEQIEEAFDITMEMRPCPAISDYSRLAVPAEVAAALGSRLARQQQTQIENAMQDLGRRIGDELKRMITQFGKVADGEGKVRLHNSLVSHMERLVDLVRDSNFTGDIDVVDLANRLEELTRHDVKEIRHNKELARDITLKAKDIMADMDEVFF